MQFIISHCRGITRFLRMLFHIGKGLVKLYWLQITRGTSWHKTTDGLDTISLWMQQLLAIFNVKITRYGNPAHFSSTGHATLFLSNHVSWLDIIIISSLTHVKFVSKDDLLYWPFVGKLSKNSGTLFLDRKNRFALRDMLKQIQSRLENNLNVLIFPEGTTTDGESVAEFRTALVQAAINSNSMVQTITLRYTTNGETCPNTPYINDDTFLPHAYRLLCQTHLQASVYFAEPVQATQQTRQNLSEASRQVMLDTLKLDRLVSCHNIASDISSEASYETDNRIIAQKA